MNFSKEQNADLSFPFQAWRANVSSVEKHVKACGGKTSLGRYQEYAEGHACQIGVVTDETYVRKKSLETMKKAQWVRDKLFDCFPDSVLYSMVRS